VTMALAILRRVVEVLLALGMAVASLTMLAQVFLRYVMAAPISWAEEFTVLLFAWLIFLGAAYVQGTDSHLAVDSLRRVFPSRAVLFLDAFRLAMIVGCSAVLIWQGIALTQRTWILLYPAMEISRGFLYLSVPVCFTIGLLFLCFDLVARRRRNAGDAGR
jgi:TRAP-type C4-dicarboxylate transport system permease small subunit